METLQHLIIRGIISFGHVFQGTFARIKEFGTRKYRVYVVVNRPVKRRIEFSISLEGWDKFVG